MSLPPASTLSPRRSRRNTLDFAIVGGGVVGAALALTLLRDGRRVAVIESRIAEAWQPTSPDLRVYALAPDSLALLDELGVGDALRQARLQPYRSMRVWDAGGGDALMFDAHSLGRDSLGAIVEHSLLVETLWAALRKQAAFTAQMPATVTGLDQADDGVELTLADGTRIRAAVAVAADGADSALRGSAGIEVDRHDYGQRGLVGYVDSELPHQETAWQRFLPGGPLALLPFVDPADTPMTLRGRRSSFVWTVADVEAERLSMLPSAEFGLEVTRAFDAHLGELTLVSTVASFALRRQLANRYHIGRVLLAGDAAHAVHPLAGHGVNLGLRDVTCLRRILAGVDANDLGEPRRLARYARERRSENAVAAWSFDGINRLFSNDAVLPTLLRGPALGLVSKLEPVRRILAMRALGE
ncbi:MAG: FAD-dependent monooxygenase [Pseudomarimonas sp.]